MKYINIFNRAIKSHMWSTLEFMSQTLRVVKIHTIKLFICIAMVARKRKV